jgi:ABC-type dipeptide/oligopeptide/nickel transport system permease component
MLLVFQSLLVVLIVLFGMGAIGADNKETRLHSTCVTIAGIGAMLGSFWVG